MASERGAGSDPAWNASHPQGPSWSLLAVLRLQATRRAVLETTRDAHNAARAYTTGSRQPELPKGTKVPARASKWGSARHSAAYDGEPLACAADEAACWVRLEQLCTARLQDRSRYPSTAQDDQAELLCNPPPW
eukprot:SAG31_NODE_4644_length_3076_cov_2.880417_2_plen_134_part_00